MPSVLIEIRQKYSQERETALMEAVHAALREAFKILPGDKNVRLVVHEPHRFACPLTEKNPSSTPTSASMLLRVVPSMPNATYTKPSSTTLSHSEFPRPM